MDSEVVGLDIVFGLGAESSCYGGLVSVSLVVEVGRRWDVKNLSFYRGL